MSEFHDYDPWDLLMKICEHQSQQAQQIINLNTMIAENAVDIQNLIVHQRMLLNKITGLNHRIRELTVNKQKDPSND